MLTSKIITEIIENHSGFTGCLNSCVATSPLALRWMCDSPWTGCARRTTPIYMWREQALIQWSRWVMSSGDSTGVHGGAMAPQFFRWPPVGPPSFFGSMEFWEMTACYSNRLRTSWALVFLLPWYEWELRSCASVIVRQQ